MATSCADSGGLLIHNAALTIRHSSARIALPLMLLEVVRIRHSSLIIHNWRTAVVIAIALLGATAPAASADDYAVLVYPCARAAQAPVIDGVLDEPAWQQATLVSGFTYYDKPELAPVQTSFRVVYDDRALYLGVICAEPALAGLQLTRPPRDSLEIFQGECVEIFVDPRHDHQRYFQFGIGVGGSLYDSEDYDSGHWNSAAQATAHRGVGEWSVELAIPWDDLGVEPRPGRVLGFNVARDRYLGPAREWSNWSQTDSNFHDAPRFAHLVLSASPAQMGQLADEFRKGGRTGPVRIFSTQGFTGKTYRALAQAALAEVEGVVSQTAGAAAGDASPDVAAEIRKGLEPFQARAEKLRHRLGAGPMDAAAWVALDRDSAGLLRDLRALLWQSRLNALLASI